MDSPMPDTDRVDPSTQYLMAVPTQVSIGGHDFAVEVHIAFVRGRFACVGIDLRSFSIEEGSEEAQKKSQILLVNEDWVEITSPVIRGLQTSAVIQKALREWQDTANLKLETAGRSMPPLEWVKYTVIGSGALNRPENPQRRGPHPQLDDDVLASVVAPAYGVGGHAPTQAVREALQTSGVLKPPVTIDQARKAVAAARKKGFIPPYAHGGKRREAEQ
jgi:hypothetical protein